MMEGLGFEPQISIVWKDHSSLFSTAIAYILL